MFATADDIAFWIVAFTAAALVIAVMLLAAQWLLYKGFGPRDDAGPVTSSIVSVVSTARSHYYLLARHSEDLRWRVEFGAADPRDVMAKRDSYREHRQPETELKIVSVPDDHLTTITALVAEFEREAVKIIC